MTDFSPNTELTHRVEYLEERVSLLMKIHRAAETNNRVLPTGLPTDADLEALAARLNALGHPVRLRILMACLDIPSKAAELTARADMGTTGQIYHHLRQLVNAGWLTASHRGRYEVPIEAREHIAVILMTATPRNEDQN